MNLLHECIRFRRTFDGYIAWLRCLVISPLLCRSSVWPGPGMVSNYEPLGWWGNVSGILLGGTSMLVVVASTAAYPLLRGPGGAARR